MRFSELEAKIEVKQHADLLKWGGRQCICVGQGRVALRLLSRRRFNRLVVLSWLYGSQTEAKAMLRVIASLSECCSETEDCTSLICEV